MKGLFKILLGLVFISGATSDASTHTDSIQVIPGSRIHTDYLGNLYVISPTNDIIRYDRAGKKTATANFKVLGNITSMDAGNPFEIYIFYRDQNRVIFLDNMLNLRGECDLESIGVSQIACVARSSDNQIWLFDLADQKLKKYSKDLKLLLESAAFSNYPAGERISPDQILDINTSVLVLNEGRIMEFDLFANFSKTLLIDTLSSFQFVNGKFVYLKNHVLEIYNPQQFRSEPVPVQLPPMSRDARIENEMLYILRDDAVILQPFGK